MHLTTPTPTRGRRRENLREGWFEALVDMLIVILQAQEIQEGDRRRRDQPGPLSLDGQTGVRVQVRDVQERVEHAGPERGPARRRGRGTGPAGLQLGVGRGRRVQVADMCRRHHNVMSNYFAIVQV